MMVSIILALLLAVSVVFIFLLVRRGEMRTDEVRRSLGADLDDARKAKAEVEAENAALRERLKFQQEEREKLERENEIRFKNLANEILETNSAKFKEQNETRLKELLTPFKTDLTEFRNAVRNAYDTEARERFSLQERLKELVEINRTIGTEAKELTMALRGNTKVQGDWGEMILETILEKSGLKRGVHFTVQESSNIDGKTLRNDQGNVLRPDVVVYYPDGRCVVIDSKVSLTAYVNFVNAAEEEKETFSLKHLQSVRSHIKELAVKNYQEYVGDKKNDFVMMFIPNEGAYMAAMNMAPDLWQEAYDRRVLIISPTHLISVLKLLEQLWHQDDMTRNVIEIATESGRMYDKFVSFVDDLLKIEKTLDAARASFDAAKKKLSTGSGNLVTRAEKLRKMGAKTQKRLNLPAVSEDLTNEL